MIFKVTAETRSYSFEGYGNTESDAVRSLAKAWAVHRKQHSDIAAGMFTVAEFIENNIENVMEIPARGEVIPCAFRDNQLIWEAGK